jgi:RHS repeat-associated protein
VTNDGINQYLYDGEGRICAVMSEPIPNNPTMMQYIYDAEGARVAKGMIATWSCDTATNGFTPTASYVLGLSNEQLTETDGQGQWKHTNVYAAGTIIATYDAPSGTPALHFQLEDWLGSRRVQTNITGTVEEWYVSLPYGDGLTPIPNLGCLPSNNCYSEDPTEHHFTGKERDTESGNDYFMARYYSSAMGRFMSPDWSAKVAPVPYAKLDDPQSLNLYAYVRNNPLSRVDVDGHNDYLWQKLKNWAEGNGYKTNAQVQGLSVAQTAANHKGDKDWAINGVNRSGGDTGHPHDFLPGKNKCNEFVGDTLAEAGKQRPEITDADGKTRMPNAHELADPSVKIPGLSDPKPLSQAQPGDVISQEHGDTYGHTGIVVGPGQTASSNFNEGGTITVNDWGFRPAGQNGESSSDPAPVVRTPQ